VILLKSLTVGASRTRLFTAFLDVLERVDRAAPDLLRVLTYHRVEREDAEPAPSPAMTIRPEAFAEQMRYLHRVYRVVSAPEVLQAVRGRSSLPPRSLLLTFDDAYRDFARHAWPVLRELGLPVTMFVPTAFPGSADGVFWWDRLHHALKNTSRRSPLTGPMGVLPLRTSRERTQALLRLQTHVKALPHSQAMPFVAAICEALGISPPPPQILDWDELRQLGREGVSMGSHTRTHPLLTRIPEEEARAEVAGAWLDLQREIPGALPILAYPAGAFDERVVRIVKEEGYALAFTTARGLNHLSRAHPLTLSRINVGPRSTLGLLRAQLLGQSAGLLPA